MATNGNPLGSRKLLAAQKRLKQEQESLGQFTATSDDSEVKIPDNMPAILKLHSKGAPIRFWIDEFEIHPTEAVERISEHLRVIRECQKVIGKYGE